MNIDTTGLMMPWHYSQKTLTVAIACTLLLGACASAPKSPDGAIEARNHLVQLQNDGLLAPHVSVAIRTADDAVTQAEQPIKDKALSDHLVFIAAREVDIAWAQAQTRSLEDQRRGLSQQRDTARLKSRTREADQARRDSAQLRSEIAELNAEATERGLVVTLGDMLFETGNSKLKNNTEKNLHKLSGFLKTYPARTLVIEGHTDNVGNQANNMLLSQNRADSIRLYLLGQGISASRLTTSGKGENFPVATNESISGRALNRRVEVIITNPVTQAIN